MLSKRVVESLRRQDWAMVFIEFVLVVVGVLLAFQINDWAIGRSEAAARHEATQRLLEEAERDVAHTKGGLAFVQRVVDELHFALDKVIGNDWSPSDERRMRDAFVAGRFMTAMVPPTSVYQDLVASGAYNKIGTPDVRAAIDRFHSTLAYDERTRQQLLPVLRAYEDNPAFTYRVDPNSSRIVDLEVDFRALAADRAAQRTISLTLANHAGLRWTRKQALRDSIAMCVALAKTLDRTCNQNRPLPKF